jgi:hypothetical protein
MKCLLPALTPAILAMTLLTTIGRSDDSTRSRDGASKIAIKVGGKTVAATLKSSAAAKDFASLLPLALGLNDYANAEKIAILPRKLNIQGEPSGSDPDVGDIAYYAPWGNIAIFYKDSPYAQGRVILGKIDSDLDALVSGKAGPITIERVPN